MLIVGAGFVGLEIAAVCRQCDKEVTVIERESRVLARAVSPVISDFYQTLHRDRGVAIELSTSVTEVLSTDGRATGLRLGDGRVVEADLIVAEDTRVSRPLLATVAAKARCVALPGFDEVDRIAPIVEQLRSGAAVALISDAGTPLISDPGAALVAACVDAGIRIIPIPGASALLAAVVASGIAGAR